MEARGIMLVNSEDDPFAGVGNLMSLRLWTASSTGND